MEVILNEGIRSYVHTIYTLYLQLWVVTVSQASGTTHQDAFDNEASSDKLLRKYPVALGASILSANAENSSLQRSKWHGSAAFLRLRSCELSPHSIP